jgi:hypothetical protein
VARREKLTARSDSASETMQQKVHMKALLHEGCLQRYKISLPDSLCNNLVCVMPHGMWVRSE